MAAAQVYVKELERLKYGYPLYNPECQVNLGDVGFFEHDSGDFCPLFNDFLEVTHPAHARDRVPMRFVPFPQDRLRFTNRSDYFSPQAIPSKSVISTDIEVEVSP
jgi:hypothetical protein